MPVTIRGGDILFNDGTTQSTAASAPNTTNVLNATAGASAGGVGTYAFAAGTNAAFGATVSGSNLRPTSAASGVVYDSPGSNSPSFPTGGALAGTWRAMGVSTPSSGNPNIIYGATLWLRIS